MDMLEEKWNAIRSKVIIPLWNKRFKNIYMSAKLDYDDFESLAGFELAKAIKTFNSEKSNLFTYSTKVITQKAMTELRDCTLRDKRRALHTAESVDGMDNPDAELPSYDSIEDSLSDFELSKGVLSEKMTKYLSRLSKLQRDVVFAMSDGYTSEEIVLKLKIPAKEIKARRIALAGFVLALTYLPGPSPDKYCRHW